MKMIAIPRTILLGGLLAGARIGCTTEPADPAQPETTGQVAFDLQIAPGFTLDAVGYTMTGPSAGSRTGTIDVSHSSTVSAIISGIPFGVGYQISLRGTITGGGVVVCMGAATFDITGPTTTSVALHMTCELQPDTGSILINGTLNVCPRIAGIDASPAEVAVGGTIGLTATASDLDHAPSPLALRWTTSSGSLGQGGCVPDHATSRTSFRPFRRPAA